LVETDANFNIIHQWPEDVAGTLNILGEQFNPHGLSVDWDKNIILTSDFVVPLSILKPSLEIIRANTLRLWNLKTRTIISTITIPNVSFPKYLLSRWILTNFQGGGIQDVKFIPGNPDSAALATAVHLGQVWIIYPFKYNSDGTQGVAELLYDLGPKARDTIAI
jgi:selenium-binding protein 1